MSFARIICAALIAATLFGAAACQSPRGASDSADSDPKAGNGY